jgi:hypothetical protein
MRKSFLFGTLTVLMSVLGTLLCAEIALRFLPYDEGLRAETVSETAPVFRFTPNRTATLSQDWDFKLVNRVRVNNAGFVNDHDYDATATSPLLAVVGDSFIQASIVPYAETVQGRLAAAVAGRGRVYSFAASGAGLPQYLAWIRHARDTYRPQALLINIIPNDFDESLHWYGRSPGFWRFERRPDGGAAMALTAYEPSLTRRILRRSALAMYLTQNMRVQVLLDINVQNLGAHDRRWVGNIEAIQPAQKIADYRWAIDRFLDLLPEASGVANDRVVLSFDSFRPGIYEGGEELAFAERSSWSELRRYFMAEAARRGHETVDLDPRMRSDFARNGRRFEPPTDSHWNGEGHRVLAESVMETRAFRGLFGSSPAAP